MLFSEGVEVIPESSLTGCRFDRSKNKIILTINGSKEVSTVHDKNVGIIYRS